MSGERFCICSCEHRGEQIGFPASGVGMRVACPHCAVETVLTEPQEQAAEKLDPISAAELKEALAGTCDTAPDFRFQPGWIGFGCAFHGSFAGGVLGLCRL